MSFVFNLWSLVCSLWSLIYTPTLHSSPYALRYAPCAMLHALYAMRSTMTKIPMPAGRLAKTSRHRYRLHAPLSVKNWTGHSIYCMLEVLDGVLYCPSIQYHLRS